jgi:hypothetical protein
MAKETGEAPEMKDLTSTSFGYLIAFVLPGLFGIYALSAWVPSVADFLKPIGDADATVGPSAVLLIISVGMGLILSALRFLTFEKLLCHKHKLPPNLFETLALEGKLSSFRAVADEHYRYHQFYGGCAVALFILFVGWWRSINWAHDLGFLEAALAFLGIEALLVFSAGDTYVKFVKRGNVVLKLKDSTMEAVGDKRMGRQDNK